jgi:serine/threonine protein kinase
MKSCPTCQRTYEDQLAFCLLDGTPLQAITAPRAGELFNEQYELESLIAQTRTGQLFRARHILLGDRMALEIFSPGLSREIAEWLHLFRREWQAASRFRHPNAVALYDLRAEYMSMEYVEGQTLEHELRQRGRFRLGEVSEVLQAVARALDAARDSGVTCEFLTTADIMIERTGNNPPSVKLRPLIFNRRSIEDRLRAMPTAAGSNKPFVAVPYLAPKPRGSGAPSDEHRDIVYSLGVIFYELLSGQKPYEGLTAQEIERKQAAGQPTPLTELAPGIPAPVARAIERALAMEESGRQATVREFVSEVHAALGVNVGAIGSRLKMGIAEAAEQPLAKRRPKAIEFIPPTGRDSAASKEAVVTDKPLYMDENVQFTVYQPEAVAPARWHTLLAFAHLSKRRPDAPPDEPEPLAEVKRIAERVLAEERTDYDSVKQNSLYAVPHRGEITFVPEIAGCEFNPPRQSFSWQKSVHKVEFEMLAAASLDGQMARGRLTVFLGSLILADVPLAIRVDSAMASARSPAEVPAVPSSAAAYRKIFPSYSHKDRAIVEQIEDHVSVLGDRYLRDVRELRAGQDWQRWMREAIEESDMFQLVWSHHSMRSVYVRQEWEYALSLRRPNFVRPTYWEEPLPESPADNLPPAELRQLHFQHLRAHSVTERATPTATSRQHPTEQGVSGTARESAASRSAPGEQLPTESGRRGGASSYIPSDGTVVCARCGGRNAAERAFCYRCGSTLKVAEQSYGETAAQPNSETATQSYSEIMPTTTAQLGSAPDVFWEVRPRETSIGQSPPPSTLSPQMSAPQSTQAALPRLFGCLLLVLLLLGIYLLVRFL